jgi:homoserine kinase
LKVTVEASASSANLGPGFDVFAIALDVPRDRITLKTEKATRLSVNIEQVKGIKTPSLASKNGAGAVCLAIARDFGIKERISLEVYKGVPIGLGMGSSGASAAAAAVGMNHLFGLGMSGDDMIFYAGKGEELVSGTAHYDNVSASILGGFVIVQASGKPTAISYEAPKGMCLCMATPEVKLPERKTEYARSVLPPNVPLNMLVSTVANASLIVSGFARGNTAIVGSGMNDRVVEGARKKLIPGYDAVRRAGKEAGAAGVCISGAGPTMLAVADSATCDPRHVLEDMLSAFRGEGVDANGFVTVPGEGAARV